VSKTTTVAVVLTCHAAYLPWLPACIASIDAQEPQPVERVLCLDRCEYEPPAGWRVIRGEWRSPNPGRNAGTEAVGARWIVFFDADNLMPPGYVAAGMVQSAMVPDACGILYPDLHDHDADMVPGTLRSWPEYERRTLLDANYIDTSAWWRRAAVRSAGGWKDSAKADDYCLATRITARGWTARKLAGPAIPYRVHPQSRIALGGSEWAAEQWATRTWTVLTLFAGRRNLLGVWHKWASTARVPPNTALWLVDDSRSKAFGADLWRIAATDGIRKRYRSVQIERSCREAPGPSPDDRDRHIADLYAEILPTVTTDYLLIVEDDMEPPHNVLPALHAVFAPGAKVGACVAKYRSPTNPEACCAASATADWTQSPRMALLPACPVPVGFAGGGCTLYAGQALRAALPVYRRAFGDVASLGWDAILSEHMRAAGYRAIVHGAVRAKHHIHGERET
jgi:hypothetical protein